MSPDELLKQTISTYTKHGWRLRRALLRPETKARLSLGQDPSLADVTISEADVDALWFARATQPPQQQGGREAWELRLLSDAPYALFYMFEADEEEEDREELRREMEAQLRDYASRA